MFDIALKGCVSSWQRTGEIARGSRGRGRWPCVRCGLAEGSETPRRETGWLEPSPPHPHIGSDADFGQKNEIALGPIPPSFHTSKFFQLKKPDHWVPRPPLVFAFKLFHHCFSLCTFGCFVVMRERG